MYITMTMKRGRKPLGKTKEYQRGYQCGFQRVRRKEEEGREPRSHMKENGKRSNEYKKGMRDGKQAARKAYKTR
jgi:hypothetical protein